MIRLRLLLLAGVLAALPACARAPQGEADPRSAAIADRVLQKLGGRGRWDSLEGLRWTFQSATGDTMRPGRRHSWDKRTGWHRVEGKNRQGQSFVLIEKLGGAGGMAWIDGQKIEGDSLKKLLTRAHSLWTNDTYWMLMPYKLRDPGVHLKYDGEAHEDGRVYDRLALSFAQVGETPGDRYWVFVDRGTDRIEKWEYVLEGEPPPPEKWTWEGWEQHDGLWFPTVHRQGPVAVYTHEIETMPRFPDGTFERP